jgi:hypothetical protein
MSEDVHGMNTPDEILSRALDLPLHDRAWLARDLLLSLEPEDSDADTEAIWASEIEARSDAVARGEFTASDWRESIARVRKELVNRRNA